MLFSVASSDMYRAEVPLCGDLIELVAAANARMRMPSSSKRSGSFGADWARLHDQASAFFHNEQNNYMERSNRPAFERALGIAVQDELEFYAKTQVRSVHQTWAKLGIDQRQIPVP